MFNLLSPQQLATMQMAATMQFPMQTNYGFPFGGQFTMPHSQPVEVRPVDDDSDDDDEDKRTLFIANLDDRVTEELLYELFLQAGPIESVRIPTTNNGQRRSFGFVTYVYQCTPPYALKLYKGATLFNKTLTIKYQGQTQSSPMVSNLPGDNMRDHHRRSGNISNRFDNTSLRSSNYAAYSEANLPNNNDSTQNPFKQNSADWVLGSNRQKDRVSRHTTSEMRSARRPSPPYRRSEQSRHNSRNTSRDRDRSHRHSEQRNNTRR